MEYNPITVSELNQYIKDKIGRDEYLNNVFIKGEISNFKHHYTGHMYFTLKDDKSLIKCIMFKSYTANLNFVPKDGLKVMILGTVSVFERDGVYQIYCKAMQEDGLGSLHVAYEELKKKLEYEGLFDVAHKKPIPKMPKCIGVLTSNTGSVIRDIINVSTRRNPNVYIKLLPVPVQGEGAAVKIAKAIKIMNEQKLADVIILARGGGSLEDLWPFNEEIVARAIYDSELPVISAVGHETDYTLCDYVADARGATPSHAAEMAVLPITTLQDQLTEKEEYLHEFIRYTLQHKRTDLTLLFNRRLGIPALQFLHKQKTHLQELSQSLTNATKERCNTEKHSLALLAQQLESLNPLQMMVKGFAKVEHNDKPITSVTQLHPKDDIRVTLADGYVNATVKEAHKDGRITKKL